MESVHLSGAEDVLRASSRIHEAAETLRQVAMSIHEEIDRFARLLGEHVASLAPVELDSATVKWEYKEEVCEPAHFLKLCQDHGAQGWRMVQTSSYPERRVLVFFERRVRV